MLDPKFIPAALVILAAIALLVHGPIPQYADYHDFADTREWLGIPNAADVLSSVAFAVVGAWGLAAARHRPEYRWFLAALVLTAAGSAWYHLQPEDDRLFWDRLPIALACAGLLYGVRPVGLPFWIAAALTSVLVWWLTEDLRPYILLQAAPLVVIPLWQWIDQAPRGERIAFGVAILLYVAAKVAELNDAEIFEALGFMSGHTLKHLLAAAASAVVLAGVARHKRSQSSGGLPATMPS